RWPFLRREFCRRRFLKTISFGPRVRPITSALTLAAPTAWPTFRSLPAPTASTWSNSILSPASPANSSTSSTSPAATLYCLPPVLITANILKFHRKTAVPAIRHHLNSRWRTIAVAKGLSTPDCRAVAALLRPPFPGRLGLLGRPEAAPPAPRLLLGILVVAAVAPVSPGQPGPDDLAVQLQPAGPADRDDAAVAVAVLLPAA